VELKELCLDIFWQDTALGRESSSNGFFFFFIWRQNDKKPSILKGILSLIFST